ncbi:MAG: molecular chaperone [Cyanobacteriota bacterium]|nr:molecular chaperone [Cyanobacteriota bacterium]
MAVKIELLTRYFLSTKSTDDKVLELPVIEITPSSNNIPHISSVSISVEGNPPELAAKIKSAYREVTSAKPIELSIPRRLRQQNCQLEEPLPTDISCTLTVEVEYFDSDAEGNPNLSERQKSKAECQIVSNSQISTPEPSAISTPSPSAIPTPQPSAIPTPEPSAIPTPSPSSTLPTPSPKSYPGWFAIDFGTSNTTVTLFDPKVTVSPNSLPREQENKLRKSLAEWLNEKPIDTKPGIVTKEWENEWQKLIAEISKELPNIDNTNQSNLGNQIFLGTNSTYLLEAIRLIELGLYQCRDWFRRSASQELNHIYHKVFRVPPLEWQSLIPVELDEIRKLSEIPSELEIESLEPDSVKVILGERARQNRLNAIAQNQDITGKFHHSPKRYLGQPSSRSIDVTLNDNSKKIKVEELVQGAFSHLIQLTSDYRDRNLERTAQGRFNKAVITYPTIAPPRVRQEVKKLVENLGIDNVEIAYDEAVSIAIFFLWREFGGDLNVGIESLKTRCRRHGDHWTQNVLVLDIGGGTTDLALIHFKLEEIEVFKDGEDRGYGGRYYKLTPQLLGSSGHLHLGGELITLQIFHLLKVAIADCLLTAVTEGNIQPDTLRIQLDDLDEKFLDNGKFRSGKLLAFVDKENAETDVAYQDALSIAEKVLPTRWKNGNAPARQQTFYTLWQYAEDAKTSILGKGQTDEIVEPTFVLGGQQIAELLAQSDLQLQSETVNNLSVTLTLSQLEKAVKPVIKEAIGIAKGLVESGLSRQEESQNSAEKEQLDWLILSGKTCNLYLVEEELYQEFNKLKSERFVWNSEKITFVPEYTKLATSAGACYAEKLRQLIFAPEYSKDLLRKGANQLYIDVKNLLYFLPCSFTLGTIDGSLSNLTIFKAGQPLYQLDPKESVARVRSEESYGAQLSIFIFRKDFQDKKEQLWGSYDAQKLATELEMTGEEFNRKIKVEFEIDQELNIKLLFCQGKPHYLISAPDNISSLNAVEVIKISPLISNGKVMCDIAVNVAESATAMKTDGHTLVFDMEKDYSQEVEVFEYDSDNNSEEIGIISKALPPVPLSGEYSFYFQYRDPNTDKWELIGKLQPDTQTEYPCEYYVSLDNKGILRLHGGTIPYWKSNNSECLKQKGYVFEDELQYQPNEIEEKRNPFSGTH